jgi:penicillin-binding protein 1B
MVKAPNRYLPQGRPGELRARRKVVLAAMVEAGFINRQIAAASEAEELALLPPQQPDGSAAPHFLDYVQREIGKLELGTTDWSTWRVETTLDLDLQQAANQVVAQHLERLDKLTARRRQALPGRPEAALVALDPQTGAILALVGGRDYRASQLNRVSDARRQPGSTFKPFVYAAALSQGISPATTFLNAPHEIVYGYQAVYRPQNYGRSYSNQPVTLREALVRSLNVVTVEAAMQTGLGNVAELAARTGLPKPETYPSLALGAFEVTPLELARAYSTFANQGVRVDPLAVRAVKQNGFTLLDNEPSKAFVLNRAQAYLVTDALADVVNRGTAARVRGMGYRGPAAGKTGTSRDAWFVGYTPKLLVVVWIGFDDHRDLKLTGGEAAVPLWTDFVKRAHELRPDLAAPQFPRPPGLEMIEIDPETGALANEYCPHRQRMLVTSYLTPDLCQAHQAPVEIFDTALTGTMRFDAAAPQSAIFKLPIELAEPVPYQVNKPLAAQPPTTATSQEMFAKPPHP